MPVTQNPKETGWFYHAPAPKQKPGTQRQEYPAPSQIPGIGYDDPSAFEKEEVKEMMFKDTDSKYIRLAKLGGRKDLLQFNPEMYGGKKTNAAAGYNRSDWFYLEDNRIEDEEKKAEEKREWDFLLPEYMVHKGYQASFSNPETPPSRGRNAPFYTADMTDADVEDQQGRSATDKTVRIPEVRKQGYGVRNEKPPSAAQRGPNRADVTVQKRKCRNKTGQLEETGPTNMMKLLSGEYEREWHTKMDALKLDESKPEKTATDTSDFNTNNNNQKMTKTVPVSLKGKEEDQREMFKMSRFQNIPAKVDSHLRTD